MNLYKTSHFREIKKINVIDFDSNSFKILLSEYRPSHFKTRNQPDDRIIERERFGTQNNYHETLEEAKEFVKNNIISKIQKMEMDLVKYKKMLSDFE